MRGVSKPQRKPKIIHGHYFLDLRLENVRCFGKKQIVNLSDDKGKPYQWTIILGENGVGKTSILKGLASLAPSPKLRNEEQQQAKLYPGLLDWREQWNTQRLDGKDDSLFEANIVAGYGFGKILKDQKQQLSVRQRNQKNTRGIDYNENEYEQLGEFLCFAYGATRNTAHRALNSNQSPAASISLFDDEASLLNVEEFFLPAASQAKTPQSADARKQREKVKALLIDLLPEVSDLRISKKSRAGRQVEAKTPYGWVRIGEMSLAYKSLMAWVVDFASRMCDYHRTKANPFHEPAVVLIDEIDLHLHPKWQRKIVRLLSKKFPNTQFIATTYSPLIAQSALDANLVLLKRSGSQVIVENHPDVIKNWRIDQLLTSELFGLTSSRSEKAEKMMTQRRNLLLKPKLNSTEKTKLQSLEKKIDYVPVAETPEYIQAMQIIRSASKKMN